MKRAPHFAPTKIADVFGFLKTNRPPLTIAEMDAAVAAEARRQVIAAKIRKP